MNDNQFKLIIISALFLLLIFSFFKISSSINKRRREKRIKAKTDEAGRKGEERLLSEAVKLRGYKRVLTNLYIPTKNGTTEIDLAIISKKGIFILECKNMSGELYGDDENHTWFHLSHNNSFSFYNPIFQNRIHINAVKNVLKMDDSSYFRSIIVLNNYCGIKNLKLKQDSYRVIRLRELKRTYRKYKKIFSKEDAEYVYRQLKQYAHANKRTKRNHIRQVSSK